MNRRRTITVPNGGDIQAAILTMRPGDILELAQDGSYTLAGGVNGFQNLPSGFPKYPTTVNGKNATITGGNTSLYLLNRNYIVFNDLNIVDATNRCVLVDGCRYITMNRVYSDSNVNNSMFDVFRFNASRNITCNDCEAGPSTGWGEHDGFECTNQCGDVVFNRCKASGVIHGFETWSDGGALTWVNYRITMNNCEADNCQVGYSAEGGPAGLSQVDMVVKNSTSTNMAEFDFQGIDGSTIYVDKFGGTWNDSVANLNLPYGGRYQTYLNKLNALAISFPTEAQMAKQDTLLKSVVNALGGDWARVKSMRIYAGSNADAALVDAKRLTLMTAVNSPSYSEDTGYTGNAVSAKIQTGELNDTVSDRARFVAITKTSSINSRYIFGTGFVGSSPRDALISYGSPTSFLRAYMGNLSASGYAESVSSSGRVPRLMGISRSGGDIHIDEIAETRVTQAVTQELSNDGLQIEELSTGANYTDAAIGISISVIGSTTESENQSVILSMQNYLAEYQAEAEYQKVIDFATANTVELPTAEQQAAHKSRLVEWISSGLWASRDFVFHFEGSNSDFSLIDWKRLTFATAVNSPAYDPEKGWSSNGSSSYISLNYNPATFSAPKWKTSSAGILAKTTGTSFTSGFALPLGADTAANYAVSPWYNSTSAYVRLGEASPSSTSGLISYAQGVRTICSYKTPALAYLHVDGEEVFNRSIVPAIASNNLTTLRQNTLYSPSTYSIGILLGGGGVTQSQITDFHNSVI